MTCMNKRLVCAIGGGIFGIVVVILLNTVPMDSPRLLKCLVDRDIPGGANWMSVQTFMWIAFGWGLGELLARYLHTSDEMQELELHLLPDNDPRITLERGDMRQVHARVANAGANGVLGNLVTLLAYQFQSTHSVSACHACLNTQADLEANRCTMNYGPVRYISWLIPSLGFIGTVYGILIALDSAKNCGPDMAAGLPKVIGDLSVAFWTTLLSLIMCCVLMLLMHIIQSREEDFHTRCCEYCLKHFINRLVVVQR